jgi:DNA helicase-2/ATP-dependent DNA helicase PcrA
MPDDVLRLYPTRPRQIDGTATTFANELNPEQLAAATHPGGPLLIIAGAGTGKTRTLIHRVAHLLASGVAPERILLLTFTRRAAQEMISRVERLVGTASGRVQGGTFHSMGHRLLRRYGQLAGIPSDFSIMDQGDAEDMMQLARNTLGLGKQETRFPKKEMLHYVYSRHVNCEIPVDHIVETEMPQFADDVPGILKVFAEYTARKQQRNLLDYDDLLLYWSLMMEQSAIAPQLSGLYEHILVDEYQDTNVLQARILSGMAKPHRNISVVGDDAQSIYSFRGANYRNILDFPKQFPGAKLVTLEQNYRSTQPILDVTNTVISRAPERFTKNLFTDKPGGMRPWLVTARDEQQQTRFVVDRVMELREDGIELNDIAVIFRAGYMSAELEVELANRKIPFEKWGGLKFLEAAHVKDVLAFLRVVDNPRDEVSWYRVLMLVPGIGDVTARSIMDAMAERGWDPDAFTHYAAPARARDAHKALSDLLRNLRKRRNDDDVAGQIMDIRRLYDGILKERYDKPEPRLADLDQLRNIASGYPSRDSFLATLALEPPQSTQDLADASDNDDEPSLVLSTAHSAKGKEWDAVIVIWAVDGWFPSTRAMQDEDELEEERRLMYVAMTRAKSHLAVVYPLNVYSSRRGMDYSIDQLSRFLDRGVREKMERIVVTDNGDDQPVIAEPVGSPVDLRALLRGRFSADQSTLPG